ncbi:glucose dehydrogenase [FAD, quinone]-like [Lucilia sericata]|uniref:glucose dehydrogenase [FAD, quinone]-like n=1 Tax=Lucilia sericata TaxID=13632 RepID=UPI0018A82CFF|nr:glucose dehydrogenase [FAD, quinone]-like [Lucilia sericata]
MKREVLLAVIITLVLLVNVSGNEAEDRLNILNELFRNVYNNITEPKVPFDNQNIWPKANAGHLSSYDYIVIGAGTAGSIVASRLSENRLNTVLVIEAGGDPPLISEVSEIKSLKKHDLFSNTSYTWNDYTEPNPNCCQGMKNERCYWPRGKMLGGTGGINGNVFLEGRPEDYNEWQQQGNKEWAWEKVQKYFTKAKTDVRLENPSKGSLVLNNFQRSQDFQITKELFSKSIGKSEMGVNKGILDNLEATIFQGERMSTAKTYLARVAKERKHNLHILKNSEAIKINFRDKTALGVEFITQNLARHYVKAKKEIIVSAGAINSPKLLMLSGIGPSELLNKLNIPLIKNLPVGQNLQDHGMMPLLLKFTKNIPPINNQTLEKSLKEFFLKRSGPLASNANLVSFINTLDLDSDKKPDVMLVTEITRFTESSNVFEFLQFKEEICQLYLKQVDNQLVLQIFGLLVRPKSRGSVKLKSSNPFEGPAIVNNYASVLEDRLALGRFVRFIQFLIESPEFQYYGLELVTIPLEECDLFKADSDEYWRCYIKYFYISAWHGAGSCRMGPINDSSAVVDDMLKVHGVQGLRVIDASIMPNITSANTNGPTIMIAEKGAQLVLDDWFEKRGNYLPEV